MFAANLSKTPISTLVDRPGAFFGKVFLYYDFVFLFSFVFKFIISLYIRINFFSHFF